MIPVHLFIDMMKWRSIFWNVFRCAHFVLETVFWQKGVFKKEHKHLDCTWNGWEWKERESQVSPPVMQTVWCPLQCGVQSSYIETVGWEFPNTTLQRGKVLHSRLWYCVSVMQRSWVKAWGRAVSRMTPRTLDYPGEITLHLRRVGTGSKRVDDLGELRMWKHILREPAMPCSSLACLAMLHAPHNCTCPPHKGIPLIHLLIVPFLSLHPCYHDWSRVKCRSNQTLLTSPYTIY